MGAEADDSKIAALLAELSGKDLAEVIKAGTEKLASVPSGGGGGGAAAPAAAAAAPAAAKKEEKKEEEEEVVRARAARVAGRAMGKIGLGLRTRASLLLPLTRAPRRPQDMGFSLFD